MQKEDGLLKKLINFTTIIIIVSAITVWVKSIFSKSKRKKVLVPNPNAISDAEKEKLVRQTMTYYASPEHGRWCKFCHTYVPCEPVCPNCGVYYDYKEF
jgi:hypothetical protein